MAGAVVGLAGGGALLQRCGTQGLLVAWMGPKLSPALQPLTIWLATHSPTPPRLPSTPEKNRLRNKGLGSTDQAAPQAGLNLCGKVHIQVHAFRGLAAGQHGRRQQGQRGDAVQLWLRLAAADHNGQAIKAVCALQLPIPAFGAPQLPGQQAAVGGVQAGGGAAALTGIAGGPRVVGVEAGGGCMGYWGG